MKTGYQEKSLKGGGTDEAGRPFCPYSFMLSPLWNGDIKAGSIAYILLSLSNSEDGSHMPMDSRIERYNNSGILKIS